MRSSQLLRMLAVGGATAVLTVGCISRGVPLEKGYMDSRQPLFELVLQALRDIGADIVAQSPQRDSATGHISADKVEEGVFLEVRLDRRLQDVTYVQVSVWSELVTLTRDDQDFWRERYYEALDALAGPQAKTWQGGPESGARP